MKQEKSGKKAASSSPFRRLFSKRREPSYLRCVARFIEESKLQPADPDSDSQYVQDLLTKLSEEGWRESPIDSICGKTIIEEVEDEVTRTFYPRFFATCLAERKRDEEISLRLRCLNGFIQPHHLDIQPDVLDEAYLAAAQMELLRMHESVTPSEKLSNVFCGCGIVDSLLQLKQHHNKGADDFLAVLIFVLIRAQPPRIASNLAYIQRFRFKQGLTGQLSYCLTLLCSAVLFIETCSASALSIDKAEFDTHMAYAQTVSATDEPQPLTPLPSLERSSAQSIHSPTSESSFATESALDSCSPSTCNSSFTEDAVPHTIKPTCLTFQDAGCGTRPHPAGTTSPSPGTASSGPSSLPLLFTASEGTSGTPNKPMANSGDGIASLDATEIKGSGGGPCLVPLAASPGLVATTLGDNPKGPPVNDNHLNSGSSDSATVEPQTPEKASGGGTVLLPSLQDTATSTQKYCDCCRLSFDSTTSMDTATHDEDSFFARVVAECTTLGVPFVVSHGLRGGSTCHLTTALFNVRLDRTENKIHAEKFLGGSKDPYESLHHVLDELRQQGASMVGSCLEAASPGGQHAVEGARRRGSVTSVDDDASEASFVTANESLEVGGVQQEGMVEIDNKQSGVHEGATAGNDFEADCVSDAASGRGCDEELDNDIGHLIGLVSKSVSLRNLNLTAADE